MQLRDARLRTVGIIPHTRLVNSLQARRRRRPQRPERTARPRWDSQHVEPLQEVPELLVDEDKENVSL